MGRDKALLSHPEGGTWLERTLALLLSLDQPVTLLSRHRAHWVLAEALQAERAASGSGGPALTVVCEPPPWEGPLRALARLVERHPGERLLLCPVDMPWLDAPTLAALLAAAANDPDPERIHLAHDGLRLQPLLGIVPATAARRQRLGAALASGERGLQRWLAGEDWRPVGLPPGPLRNLNRPQDLGPSVSICTACGP